jgi:hypothetical protein
VRQLWLTALLLVAACAAPTQYLVNTTSDFSDTNLGDHTCAGRGNLCSLRGAIEETNTHQAGDAVRIVVPAGTYDLTHGEISLTHDAVTLRGDDRDTTIIRHTSGGRVFTITTSGDIWIGRVTLRDGITGNTGRGGAIRIDDNGSHSLTLSECRITDNRAGFMGGRRVCRGSERGSQYSQLRRARQRLDRHRLHGGRRTKRRRGHHGQWPDAHSLQERSPRQLRQQWRGRPNQ